MKKLIVEVEIIADGMAHHVAKAFFHFQVLLAAVVTEFALQYTPTVKAIVLFTVMFFHGLVKRVVWHAQALHCVYT